MNLIFYRKAMVVHFGEDLRQLQDHSSCTVSAHQPWSRRSKRIADYMRLHAFQKKSINSCWGLQSVPIARLRLHIPLGARLLVKSPLHRLITGCKISVTPMKSRLRSVQIGAEWALHVTCSLLHLSSSPLKST